MTLKVQQFLLDNNLDFELLTQKYGIICNRNPCDNRIILNYDQIESYAHRYDDLTRECRALVLDARDGYLIARSFFRFFNWGENRSEMKKFIWEGSRGYDKEDGSLINIFHYDNSWRVHTRNSFGDGKLVGTNKTWTDLVNELMPPNFWTNAPPEYSYTFELCTPYNKVVRQYSEPKLFFLSAFNGEYELEQDVIGEIGKSLKLDMPAEHIFEDILDAEAYVASQERIDKTFEGVIIRDSQNVRFKIKSSSYIALHRCLNNGNIILVRNLLPIILDGELDETVAYFPEAKDKADKLKAQLDKWERELSNFWFCYHDLESRKKYAELAKKYYLSGLLFKARDSGINPAKLMRSKDYIDYMVKKLEEAGYE